MLLIYRNLSTAKCNSTGIKNERKCIIFFMFVSQLTAENPNYVSISTLILSDQVRSSENNLFN